MNKIWYFLREVVWSAVLSIVLLLTALAVALFTNSPDLALVLVIGSLTLATLSKREL